MYCEKSEMCVCDLAEILGVTQSAVSHQLRMLKQMKLVKNRRDGKTVYYSLADGHIQVYYQSGHGAYYRIKRYVKMTDQSVFLHLG